MRRAGILLAVLVLSTVLGAPEAHADPGAGGLSGVLDLRLTPGYDTNPTIMTTQDWTATDVLVTGELANIGAFVGPVKVDVTGNEGGTLITSQGVLNGTFSGHVEGLLFGSGDFFSEYTRVGSVVVGTASGHFSVCAGTGTCTTTTSLSAFAGGVIAGVIVPKTTGPIDAVLFTGALVLAGT
jgi:hypothetical protein